MRHHNTPQRAGHTTRDGQWRARYLETQRSTGRSERVHSPWGARKAELEAHGGVTRMNTTGFASVPLVLDSVSRRGRIHGHAENRARQNKRVACGVATYNTITRDLQISRSPEATRAYAKGCLHRRTPS